jgi:hypothetical protein
MREKQKLAQFGSRFPFVASAVMLRWLPLQAAAGPKRQ